MVVFIFFFNFRPKSWVGGAGHGPTRPPLFLRPCGLYQPEEKAVLEVHVSFPVLYLYRHTSWNAHFWWYFNKYDDWKPKKKKFVHNLKALKKFLQSPKAKKKLLPTQNCPTPPPPKKNNKMVHPLLQLNKAKWLRQNEVSRKLEPSVYQKSTAFHGNSRYGATGTKSYGLLVGRKSFESVYSPGRQWVNTQPRWNGACDGNSELHTRKLYKFSNFKARFSCKSKRSRWLTLKFTFRLRRKKLRPRSNSLTFNRRFQLSFFSNFVHGHVS